MKTRVITLLLCILICNIMFAAGPQENGANAIDNANVENYGNIKRVKRQSYNTLDIINCVLNVAAIALVAFLAYRKHRTDIEKRPSQMSEIKNIEEKLGAMVGAMNMLSQKLDAVDVNSSTCMKNLSVLQASLQASRNQVAEQQQVKKPASSQQVQKQAATPQNLTLYVQPDMVGSDIKLIDGGEDYKEYMPFVLRTSGNNATIAFNDYFLDKALNGLEVYIIPYSNCTVETSRQATTIVTVKEGCAKQNGGDWIVTEKPSLRVS